MISDLHRAAELRYRNEQRYLRWCKKVAKWNAEQSIKRAQENLQRFIKRTI